MTDVKTVKTEQQIIVDSETGEIIDVKTNKIKVYLSKDKFALVYATFWDALLETNLSKSDIDVLAFLIKSYGDGTPFSISGAIKEEICKRTSKSKSSYKNSTKSLLDAKFIYYFNSKRTYKLNPKLAFEGNSNNRKKAIIEMLDFCPDC